TPHHTCRRCRRSKLRDVCGLRDPEAANEQLRVCTSADSASKKDGAFCLNRRQRVQARQTFILSSSAHAKWRRVAAMSAIFHSGRDVGASAQRLHAKRLRRTAVYTPMLAEEGREELSDSDASANEQLGETERDAVLTLLYCCHLLTPRPVERWICIRRRWRFADYDGESEC
ncbi:unnamed protein product, partial [Phaeothamnion confervicola]